MLYKGNHWTRCAGFMVASWVRLGITNDDLGTSWALPGDNLGMTWGWLGHYFGKTWQDSGILWHTLAYSGILCHTLSYSCILWHTLAYSGILCHWLFYNHPPKTIGKFGQKFKHQLSFNSSFCMCKFWHSGSPNYNWGLFVHLCPICIASEFGPLALIWSSSLNGS